MNKADNISVIIKGIELLIKRSKGTKKQNLQVMLKGMNLLLKRAKKSGSVREVAPITGVKTDIDTVLKELGYGVIEKDIYDAVGKDNAEDYLSNYDSEYESQPNKELDYSNTIDDLQEQYDELVSKKDEVADEIADIEKKIIKLKQNKKGISDFAVKIRQHQGKIFDYKHTLRNLTQKISLKKMQLDNAIENKDRVDIYINDTYDYNAGEYRIYLTQEGVDMVNKIRARLQTRQGIASGTDLFPQYEYSGVEELKNRIFKNGGEIASMKKRYGIF